jgi:prepilin-type processing-associated H-X9-DG protein
MTPSFLKDPRGEPVFSSGEKTQRRSGTSQAPNGSPDEWSSALWWGSAIPGVSRFAAIATTAPKLNADLQIPDPNPTYSYTGDVDSWVYDPDPAVNALNAGQFGFRSPHPSGANFLFGDGSVKFLIDPVGREASA